MYLIGFGVMYQFGGMQHSWGIHEGRLFFTEWRGVVWIVSQRIPPDFALCFSWYGGFFILVV
jgi:hypothetical protein